MSELFGIPPMSYKDAIEASVDAKASIFRVDNNWVKDFLNGQKINREFMTISIPIPPKDFARIQRNINVDWMNLCLKLIRSKAGR